MVSEEPEGAGQQSAVLVRLPEAEAIVGPHRSRFDPAHSWGVPAHVTVLFPFIPPAALTEGVLQRLAEAVATVEAFQGSLARTAWFGEDVLWLAPTPDEPFRLLTHAVCAAFPGHLPYGGAHDEVIPHLTVGERRQATWQALRVAERELAPLLPITYRVREVTVMAGDRSADSWRVVQSIAL